MANTKKVVVTGERSDKGECEMFLFFVRAGCINVFLVIVYRNHHKVPASNCFVFVIIKTALTGKL